MVPASVSHLLGARPAEGFAKETDMKPGAPAESVELDVKRSDSGRPPGAAYTPAGLGPSGTPVVVPRAG